MSRIEWYKDKQIAIFFDDIPSVDIRYPFPTMDKRAKMSIKKYPFINNNELMVTIFDYKEKVKYEFSIPSGYCFDGASIPRMFWRLIGSNTDNTFLIAAMIHDRLCENHSFVKSDRNLSSRVFRGLLKAGGVGKVKAQIMYLAVDNFQRFCKW